jgi:hypothetical protein
MVLFRALGWLLLGLSVAVAVRDALYWWSEGAFHPLSLGGLWLQLDFSSLQSLEALVGRHLSAFAWSQMAAPLLKAPALPTFVAVGLLLLWFGRGRGAADEEGFALTARRPRRRRRGGL